MRRAILGSNLGAWQKLLSLIHLRPAETKSWALLPVRTSSHSTFASNIVWLVNFVGMFIELSSIQLVQKSFQIFVIKLIFFIQAHWFKIAWTHTEGRSTSEVFDGDILYCSTADAHGGDRAASKLVSMLEPPFQWQEVNVISLPPQVSFASCTATDWQKKLPIFTVTKYSILLISDMQCAQTDFKCKVI